ncbi:MAG: Rab family GTPase [Promethearchaeota archaeon]
MDFYERNSEQLYKVCLVGDGGVGKSAILRRFLRIEEKFQNEYKPTIGTEITVKSLIIDEMEINLQIWDIAGQPHFKFIRSSFYKGSHAIIMVFDLTAPSTLYNLTKWKNEVITSVSRPIPFLIVGNKNDLQSTIDSKEITDFIEKLSHTTPSYSPSVFFTSALTGHNINEVFEILGRSILEFFHVKSLPSLQAPRHSQC